MYCLCISATDPMPSTLSGPERIDVGLGEPQVGDRPDDLAVLDEEHPVAGQAR